MATTTEILLPGCRPLPLAHYLKALGIHRLIAEQADERVRGAWKRDCFVLFSDQLDADDVVAFLLERYRPTPIIAPWNGGSGFFPDDNQLAIDAIRASSADRLEAYRQAIATCSHVLTEVGLRDCLRKWTHLNERHAANELSKKELKKQVKALKDEEVKPRKPTLLESCRARLPDEALAWLDAAYVLSFDKPRYPPLLGTGGNDGRLDFTNNFMQRLLDVIDPEFGRPRPAAASWLAAALFDEPRSGLTSAKIGQFYPGAVGGANATTGFDAGSVINPWDFVLMLEGATCFAAAVGRRHEHDARGAWSYPFTVRQSAAGYGSAAPDDETSARAEMWLPLWNEPASFGEIDHMLSEGRAQVGGRAAVTGVDFARAVATLGVDRGIESFQRIGFQVRNGLAYLATPLQRLHVGDGAAVRLLEELDPWLDRFFRAARGKTAPGSVARAAKRLETAILSMAERSDPARSQEVFLGLAGAERALSRTMRWATESYLRPLPSLAPDWATQIESTVETRLAMAIGSVYGWYRADGRDVYLGLRPNLEPVTTIRRDGEIKADWALESRDVVWTHGHLLDSLSAVFGRRLLWAERRARVSEWDRAVVSAGLADIAQFLDGCVDDRLLDELIWACALIDWGRASGEVPEQASSPVSPGADYALLKLCFVPADARPSDEPLVLESRIHRLLVAGRGTEASRLAARRLRARGHAPAVAAIHTTGERAVRLGASLLIPIPYRATATLASVLRPRRPEKSPYPEEAQPVKEKE